jgi:tetratricopeptide (TPR) repeat protein
MNLFDRIAAWLGLDAPSSTAATTEVETLRATLDQGRRYKRAGQYDNALLELEKALNIAHTLDNDVLPVAIKLQQADVFTHLGQWQDANQLLDELAADVRGTAVAKPQLAYVEIGRGLLAQGQRAWETARVHFEKALDIARSVNAIGAEGRAQGHLADIYLDEGNASYAAYLLEDALPKLNASGDIEMSSYFVGLLGKAKIINGQRRDGQQLLGRALRLAEHMGYRAHELRWRQDLSVEAMQEGLFDDAKRHLLVVLSHLETGQTSKDHVPVLCRISKACLRLGEYDAALDYAEQAYDLIAEDTSTQQVKMAQAAYGIALRVMGDFKQAQNLLQAAVSDYQPTTEADYRYTELLRNLGAVQSALGDDATAEQTYQRAQAEADRLDDRVELAGIHRDAGIHYAKCGKAQDAIHAWVMALRLFELEGHHARVARLYCDLANIRREEGQFQRAMRDYERALMALGSVDDQETRGIVLSNAATAYIDHGDVTTAESFFTQSIQIAHALGDHRAEATRRGNYGLFLLRTGRPKSAQDTLSYALRQSKNLSLFLQFAVQTDNLGLVYDALGDYETARRHHQQALDSLDEATYPVWVAVIRANLGHTLLALGQGQTAQAHLSAALQVGRDSNRPGIIIPAILGLVRLALQAGDDALNLPDLLQEAIDCAEAYGSRWWLSQALIMRSRYAIVRQDLATARADWERAHTILTMLRDDADHFKPDGIE